MEVKRDQMRLQTAEDGKWAKVTVLSKLVQQENINMKRKLEEMLRLVKAVVKWDLDSESGYAAFGNFAREVGIKKENLMYYVNAYQASGKSGLKALTYKKTMPETVRIEATKELNEFLSARLPRNEHAGQLWFQVVAKDNRITVAEKRPLFGDPSQSSTSEFVQLRYTDYDGKWHIYWKRASGKWWPYVPHRKIESFNDCLHELGQDLFHCFWG